MRSVNGLASPECLETFKNDPVHRNNAGEYEWNLTPAEHSDLMRALVHQFPANDRADGICAYCEKQCDRRSNRFDDHHAEADHFRPRKYFRPLMFEWDNLMLVCRQCNQSKGKQFPGKTDDWAINESSAEALSLGKSYMSPSEVQGYVNPREPDPERYFEFDPAGKVVPSPSLPDEEWSKAKRTINDFDLNHLDVDQRRDHCQRRTFQFFMAYHAVRQLGTRRARFVARRMPYSSFISWAQSQGYFDMEPLDLPLELRNGFHEIVQDI